MMRCGLGIIPPLFTLHTMLTHCCRYCELQMTDRNKIPAFSKLPWLLVRPLRGGAGAGVDN